jgi:hypothetical protein
MTSRTGFPVAARILPPGVAAIRELVGTPRPHYNQSHK